MRCAVVLDGLRRDLVTEPHMPALSRFARRSRVFGAHRSMFPSATRVVSASFATGCTPARHELAGNTLALLEEGRRHLS
jgi:predicted AlkP superfamily pyrophosphatase or phosphodiesterase